MNVNHITGPERLSSIQRFEQTEIDKDRSQRSSIHIKDEHKRSEHSQSVRSKNETCQLKEFQHKVRLNNNINNLLQVRKNVSEELDEKQFV